MRLVAATRHPDKFGIKDLARYLTYGASPRATIHLIEGARALAYLRGRTYVLPEDVSDLAPDVLRHRLSLSYEALADAQSADQLIQRIMQHVPRPEKPLESHVRIEPKPVATRTPEAVLRRLEWTVIRRLDGVLHGDYRTLFRGHGLDLADLREYHVRRRRPPHRLERHGAPRPPYVREYNEEREVAAWFLLDLSASVNFGSQELEEAGDLRASSSRCSPAS